MDRTILLFGGYSAVQNAFLNTCDVYNVSVCPNSQLNICVERQQALYPQDGHFARTDNMKTERMWFGAAFLHGDIYAVGGHNGQCIAILVVYFQLSSNIFLLLWKFTN